MSNSEAFLNHILSRLTADLEFLQSQSYITPQTKSQILEKLPKPSASSNDNLRSSSDSSPINSVISRISSFSINNSSTSSTPPRKPAPAVPGSSSGGYTPPSMPQPQNNSTTGGFVPPPPRRNVPAPPPPQDNGSYCKALWDYQGNQPDDLLFRKGDIIKIIAEENQHWWKGELNGQEGLFPSNHVERLPPSFSPPPSSYATPPPSSYPPPPPSSSGYYPPTLPTPDGKYSPYPPPQPYVLPPQQYAPPPQPVVVQQPSSGGGMGGMKGKFANSLVGGLGFGAGAAVGADLVNSIF